jgi:uncharacterized protein YyaL (SSP411 family)
MNLPFRIMRRAILLASIFVGALLLARAGEPIAWHPWSPEIFAQAKREHKFVILDLEAVWCHWCHVMAETTYQDPKVVALMGSNYLAVRVDQDARPDLSNRYEDYGWPATIIFGPDGSELVKRQGYIPPEDMISLLQAVIDDPTPGPSVHPEPPTPKATDTILGDRRAAVVQAWREGYDEKAGGWGFSHKYLDWDSVEFALRLAAHGDAPAAAMARDTLRLQRKLLDPVWGGVYQYSVGGDWNEPHFEKIMQMQAENLRIYAQAYAQWNDPADLATAQAIHRYLRAFLTSPDGVVYTSQDADLVPGEHSADYYALDDAARRARGIPRVDTHIYARENGWVIVALVQLAEATGDNSDRVEAERAARWVLAHRALPGGGFRHDERDLAGPYLGDTLAMGRAFFALYQLTADAPWLAHAVEAAEFIRANFDGKNSGGIPSSATTGDPFPAPRPQFDENVSLVRFAVALSRATGRPEFRDLAASALRWAIATGVAGPRGFSVGGLLLAEEEMRTEPLHVMIVGRKDDPVAQVLQAAALRVPDSNKLVEWWDRREGAAPRGENIYPEFPQAAAFVCANGACSLPMFAPAALMSRLAKVAK